MRFFQKIAFIFLLFPFNWLHAQRQSDVVWAGNSLYSGPAEVPGSNFLVYFNEDSLEFIDNDVSFSMSGVYSRSSYSDKLGNFKFASNGWRLVNSLGEVLSYKLWSDDIPWPGGSPDTTMVSYSKGPLFLEDPGDSNRVYLFYGEYKTIIPPPESVFDAVNMDLLFSYALLDVATQSLISQNNIILSDTTSMSDAVAVRHGNGRDWWIVKPGLYTNEYYIALLNPDGLSEMEHVIIPGLEAREQTYTVSHFTQDGNKFIHFTGLGPKWVQRYEFDRCTGTLSNPIETDLTGLFRELDPCNFTISPDGSKFYAVRLNYNDSTYLYGTYQYDFDNDSLSYIHDKSGLAFLTPNFKEILFYTRNSPIPFEEMFFSTISNPNGAGPDCDTILFKYPLQNAPYMLYAPNLVNYRLGPLVGSECETVAIDQSALENKPELSVFPNPVRDMLHVRFKNHNTKAVLNIRNMQGAVIYKSELYINEHISMAQLNLSEGIYFIEVLTESELFREKVICLR